MNVGFKTQTSPIESILSSENVLLRQQLDSLTRLVKTQTSEIEKLKQTREKDIQEAKQEAQTELFSTTQHIQLETESTEATALTLAKNLNQITSKLDESQQTVNLLTQQLEEEKNKVKSFRSALNSIIEDSQEMQNLMLPSRRIKMQTPQNTSTLSSSSSISLPSTSTFSPSSIVDNNDNLDTEQIIEFAIKSISMCKLTLSAKLEANLMVVKKHKVDIEKHAQQELAKDNQIKSLLTQDEVTKQRIEELESALFDEKQKTEQYEEVTRSKEMLEAELSQLKDEHAEYLNANQQLKEELEQTVKERDQFNEENKMLKIVQKYISPTASDLNAMPSQTRLLLLRVDALSKEVETLKRDKAHLQRIVDAKRSEEVTASVFERYVKEKDAQNGNDTFYRTERSEYGAARDATYEDTFRNEQLRSEEEERSISQMVQTIRSQKEREKSQTQQLDRSNERSKDGSIQGSISQTVRTPPHTSFPYLYSSSSAAASNATFSSLPRSQFRSSFMSSHYQSKLPRSLSPGQSPASESLPTVSFQNQRTPNSKTTESPKTLSIPSNPFSQKIIHEGMNVLEAEMVATGTLEDDEQLTERILRKKLDEKC
ncbi:uncharacterized protein MONOS_9836 [Monocercomonoides exilis]|uniref:uncharacterized protein n=1 Tax=Monocercomonoides exilis TaxID=2049356 RepID=UPI00355A5874|nr:hypothetical protein MONOS_9836 [Monocercomonoides exilis]|eukprot:MONOS_9836.1-p1 / transcript=MONOS_9836.1 / gene=MONOS_9836 / organism=Monocercomonoides_exilis_PA203 / gene_product=unspecified product / transcript_product=unspecified product / location=Mono_scaffold00421:12448-14825(-) / protein_length=599 / sequence_SO=supercontig / SO=protein_coding / is_pseudo=false